jgi:hypothetical protein
MEWNYLPAAVMVDMGIPPEVARKDIRNGIKCISFTAFNALFDVSLAWSPLSFCGKKTDARSPTQDTKGW